jgi:hypothetical protein
MRYWCAHFDHPSKPLSKARSNAKPILEAPPTLDVPSSATPSEGDRVIFKGFGPNLGSTRPHCVGLAEVTAVGAVHDGKVTVGLRTVVCAIAYIHRGGRTEWLGGASITISKLSGPWAPLNLAEAEILFQSLHVAAEGEPLPTWFDTQATARDELPEFDPTDIEDGRERRFRSVVERQGQPAFRDELLAAYEGKCAISGCAVRTVLEAAHIIAYQGAATNVVQNGLLLRADLHALFDQDLIWINPDTYEVSVAPSLQGSDYWQFDGRVLRPPASPSQRPSTRALRARRLGSLL